MIALAVVGLFGFSALAIDGSRVFSDRRNAQNAADTSALSAALAKIRATAGNVNTAVTDAAIARASSNGYDNDANSAVEVHFCNDPAITTPCQGIPTTTRATPPPLTLAELAVVDPANYIQVKITSTIPATFARVIGRRDFTNIVTAIAYAGPVKPKPLANGAALAAMAPHEPDAIFGNGNIDLTVLGSGIFSNSDVMDTQPPCQEGSMSVTGNGNYQVETSILVVGSFCINQNSSVTPPNAVTTTGQIPYPPPFDVQMPNIVCSGNGSYSEAIVDGDTIRTYYPGNYGTINYTWTGEVHFSPGNYCFNGGVSFLGPDIIANSANFKIAGGDFRISGNGTFTCNDVLVHIDGGSGMRFNGNGEIACNSITFIASTGTIQWNGAVTNRLFAPTGGEYQGLLIYMPHTNNNDLSINGNADNRLTGSIIAMGSNISIGGNSWTTGLNSQIIGYTIDIQGGTEMVIDYDPEDQFLPLDPNSVTLTK
jgi:Flp pilus assembly protein TadG